MSAAAVSKPSTSSSRVITGIAVDGEGGAIVTYACYAIRDAEPQIDSSAHAGIVGIKICHTNEVRLFAPSDYAKGTRADIYGDEDAGLPYIFSCNCRLDVCVHRAFCPCGDEAACVHAARFPTYVVHD